MTVAMSRMAEIIRLVWATALLFVSLPWMYPIAKSRRGPLEPWVIGGHGGRLRADNSEALHDYLLEQGAQAVVFITGNKTLLKALRARGIAALERHSLAARWAILKAPVLIYSHGEDDLDFCQLLLRRHVGLRVFLNHSMNYLKAGQYHRPDIKSLRGVRRWLFDWLVTDFDVLLASSPREKRHFELSYPGREADIVLGGGAHIDAFMSHRVCAQQRTILYFPTFRDDARGRLLLHGTLCGLAGHAGLRHWLRDQDYRLLIGSHINTGQVPLDLPERMVWMDPANVRDCLFECQLFISDYSGLIFDYLALEKPIALFPFDLDNYLRTRCLYSDYQNIAYGPVVRSLEALVALILSGCWKDQAPFEKARQRLRADVFPFREPRYARGCYDRIRRLAARGNDHGQGV